MGLTRTQKTVFQGPEIPRLETQTRMPNEKVRSRDPALAKLGSTPRLQVRAGFEIFTKISPNVFSQTGGESIYFFEGRYFWTWNATGFSEPEKSKRRFGLSKPRVDAACSSTFSGRTYIFSGTVRWYDHVISDIVGQLDNSSRLIGLITARLI